MPKKKTNENLNYIHEKLEYIGFDLEKPPAFLKEFKPLNYRVPKAYDETTYKVYRYVGVKDIQILLTPTERLEELETRYKLASPIYSYMKPEKKEDIEKYASFLKLINDTQKENIEEIQQEQQKLQQQVPFEVKYKNNFKWQTYYSDATDSYFMLAPIKEIDNSAMLYLLKEQIAANKSRRKKVNTVFIPISNEDYSGTYLKKSEIADIENYLWYFTKDWVSIYEVYNQENEMSIQIVGKTTVYQKMQSPYKIVLNNKKEATTFYKLMKALFIMASEIPENYCFTAKISEQGGLDFYFKKEKIEYEKLASFIKEQCIEKKKETVTLQKEIKECIEELEKLKRKSEEQNEEYLAKERKIVTFLECKKSFFGKIKYFFTSKKASKKIEKKEERLQEKAKKETKIEIPEIEEKEKYTIEDLIYICKKLDTILTTYKNKKLDKKALLYKIENMQRKIDNATLYINEIEEHQKSIFEFWKYTNKDAMPTLNQGEEEENANKEKLKKFFDYEDDIELLGKKVDEIQRHILEEKEFDSIFITKQVLEGIQLVGKEKLLKADKEKLAKLLKKLQKEYEQDIELIHTKDFDIFGSVIEDRTKIKTLHNEKHREIQKDKFEVLGINLKTTIEQFIDNLKKMREILQEAYLKIESPYELNLYQTSEEILPADNFQIFELNPQIAIEKMDKESTNCYLYQIHIPEKAKAIFYSNIMFYDNKNKTLPLGMDVEQEVLLNLDCINIELIKKDTFWINEKKSPLESKVKQISVYEYDIQEKGEETIQNEEEVDD